MLNNNNNNQPRDRMSDNQIHQILESITGKQIACFHEEAKVFAFKFFTGEWATINKEHITG
jgi:hypothetical protein